MPVVHFRLELLYDDTWEPLVRRPRLLTQALLRSLREGEFQAVAVWPRQDRPSAALIVAGDGDADALAGTIAAAVEAAGVGALEVQMEALGELPDDVSAQPAEERSQVLIEMAVPLPGRTCRRCGAGLPPHQGWCPWDVGEDGRTEKIGGEDDSRGGSGGLTLKELDEESELKLPAPAPLARA